MTLTILIVLLALVLWTLIPTPKSNPTAVRDPHQDDNLR